MLLIDGLKLEFEVFLCCIEGVPYHHGNCERPHSSRNGSDNGCLLSYIVKVYITQQLGFAISCLDTSDPCNFYYQWIMDTFEGENSWIIIILLYTDYYWKSTAKVLREILGMVEHSVSHMLTSYSPLEVFHYNNNIMVCTWSSWY